MSGSIHMRLGNPFFIGIWSLALLSIGAAIGARWGHSPQIAVWMIVVGAALMIAHDIVAFTVIFLFSTAWNSRANRKREAERVNLQAPVANAGSPRTTRSADNPKSRQKA